MGNENSNRRSFIRKLVGLTAVSAIAGSLLGQLQEKTGLPSVEAANGDPLIIGQINTGTTVTTLRNSAGHAFAGESTATSGTNYGVWGKMSSEWGAGVLGEAFATSGMTCGVEGVSVSTGGMGVVGIANASSGPTYGVHGLSNSTSGIGVRGGATASSGYTCGVCGHSNSTDGMGVWGVASASSGPTYGVDGWSSSTSGTGIRGIASASSGPTRGVYGESNSTDGIGVEARNEANGVALRVSNGRSQFSTIVDGTIPAGSDSATVTDSRVGANSEVMVMLMSDPGTAAPHGPLSRMRNSVSWVNIAAGSFTVYLLGPAAVAVPFRAYIAEKA